MDQVSFLAAFAAGVVSFLSPCVLPLVPGYLSIVSGLSLDQLKDTADAKLMRMVVRNSIFFIIGFSITFITLGASATQPVALRKGVTSSTRHNRRSVHSPVPQIGRAHV